MRGESAALGEGSDLAQHAVLLAGRVGGVDLVPGGFEHGEPVGRGLFREEHGELFQAVLGRLVEVHAQNDREQLHPLAGFDSVLLVQLLATGELGLEQPVERLEYKLGELGVEDEVRSEDVQAGVQQLDQRSENFELAPLLVTDIGLGRRSLEGHA